MSPAAAIAMFGLIFVVLAGVMIGGAMLLDMGSCYSRWRPAGYEVSWGPLQECVVHIKSGWVPENTFRQFKPVE